MYIGDFKIHRISTNYVRYLSQYDINVKYNEKNKRTRIYLGVGVTIDKIRYFVPLCSPDEKSKFLRMNETTDFMKIQDKNNKLLCVLNISSMIPVPESEIVYVDFKLESTSYSYLLRQEYHIIRKRKEEIYNNVNKLYEIITKYSEKNKRLAERCCNYPLLEQKMFEYMEMNKINSEVAVTNEMNK